MTQRKILFHISQLNIGGAERSSVRMINMLARKDWKITVVVDVGGGGLETSLDSRVEVIYLRKELRGLDFKLEKGFLRRLLMVPKTSLYFYDRFSSLLIQRKFYKKHYDAACILLMGTRPNFVCKYVNATSRFHWIRNDLKQTPNAEKIRASINKWWSYIDKYICVSKTAEAGLLDLCPQVKGKTQVVYNILNTEEMLAKSNEKPDREFSSEAVNILSVCRLKDSAKAVFRLVDVCTALRDRGLCFKWYVIGDGPDREALKSKIRENKLENQLVLLGMKDNPFPYYKMTDIVAMLSYHEGLCGVINEAKVLKKAVIATEVSGVHEQLIDRKTGIIVKQDTNLIVEALMELISDQTLRDRLAESGYPDEILKDERKLVALEKLFVNQ